MARAIDADKLLEQLQKKKCGPDNKRYTEGFNDCLMRVRSMVHSAPTLTPPNEPLPVLVNDEPDREYIDYICSRCKNTISQRRRGQRMETVYKCKFHDNCGQRVDWSKPQFWRPIPGLEPPGKDNNVPTKEQNEPLTCKGDENGEQ